MNALLGSNSPGNSRLGSHSDDTGSRPQPTGSRNLERSVPLRKSERRIETQAMGIVYSGRRGEPLSRRGQSGLRHLRTSNAEIAGTPRGSADPVTPRASTAVSEPAGLMADALRTSLWGGSRQSRKRGRCKQGPASRSSSTRGRRPEPIMEFSRACPRCAAPKVCQSQSSTTARRRSSAASSKGRGGGPHALRNEPRFLRASRRRGPVRTR
jgi:hypothetical protein